MDIFNKEDLSKIKNELDTFINNLQNLQIEVISKDKANTILSNLKSFMSILRLENVLSDEDKFNYNSKLKDFVSQLENIEINYGIEKSIIDEENMRGIFKDIKAIVSTDTGEYVTGYNEFYPDLVKDSLSKHLKNINEGNRRYRFETNTDVIKQFIETLTPQELSPQNIIKESFSSIAFGGGANKRFYANDTFLASLSMRENDRRFYSSSEIEDKINTFNDYKNQIELIYSITNRLTGFKVSKFDKIMREISDVLNVVMNPLGALGEKINEHIGVNFTSYMAYKIFMILGVNVPKIPENIDNKMGSIPFMPDTITDAISKLGFDLFKVGRNNVAYYIPEPYYNQFQLLEKKNRFRKWYNRNTGSTSEYEVYSYNTEWQILQKFAHLSDEYVNALKSKVTELQKFLTSINGDTKTLTEESKNLIDIELQSFLKFLKMEENSRKYQFGYKGSQYDTDTYNNYKNNIKKFIDNLNERFKDKEGKLLKGYTTLEKKPEDTIDKIADKFAVNIGRIHTSERMTSVFLKRYNRFKKIPEVSVGGPRHTHVFFIRPNLSIFTKNNTNKFTLIEHPDPQIIYMAKRFPNFIGYLDKDYGVNSDTPLNIPFTNYCKRLSINDVTIDLNNHNANNLGSFQKTLGPKERNMYNITFNASFHKDNVDSILHMVEYWEYYTRQARLGVITPRKETLMKNYVDSFSSIFVFETAVNDIDIISWAKFSNVLPTSIPYSEKTYDIKSTMQYETNVSFYAEKFTFNQVYHLIEFNKIMTGIPNIGDLDDSTLPKFESFNNYKNDFAKHEYSHILERGDDFWYPKKAVVRMVNTDDIEWRDTGISYVLGFLGEEKKK